MPQYSSILPYVLSLLYKLELVEAKESFNMQFPQARRRALFDKLNRMFQVQNEFFMQRGNSVADSMFINVYILLSTLRCFCSHLILLRFFIEYASKSNRGNIAHHKDLYPQTHF